MLSHSNQRFSYFLSGSSDTHSLAPSTEIEPSGIVECAVIALLAVVYIIFLCASII